MDEKKIWFAIVSSIILLSGFTGITIYQDVFAVAEKTLICHKPGTSAQAEMEVSNAALQSHLDHGDFIGTCDNDPESIPEPTTGFTEITCECELSKVNPPVCTQTFCSDSAGVNSFCTKYCTDNDLGASMGGTCVNASGCTLP